MWAKPLHDGSRGVVAFNRGPTALRAVQLPWAMIGLPADSAARVRDLTNHVDLANVTAGSSASQPLVVQQSRVGWSVRLSFGGDGQTNPPRLSSSAVLPCTHTLACCFNNRSRFGVLCLLSVRLPGTSAYVVPQIDSHDVAVLRFYPQ